MNPESPPGTIPVAEAFGRLGTESAFDMGARARALEAAGRSIIHLEIGEPDFPTASHIIDAAHQAMIRGETHYGPPLGIPDLREAVAAHLALRGIPAGPGSVAVAPGAKPLVFFSMMALLSPGDEVIVPDPAFPIYASVARYLGATPVPLRLRPELDFRFTQADLAGCLSRRTRLIVLNSPHNPTGGMLGPAELALIATVARDRDLRVLSDEIYSRLVYAGEHHSIAALPDMVERTIVLDGLSKAYAMTGWRIGYAHFPAPLVPVIERFLINSVSCTPAFTQRAAAAALTGPQDAVDAMLAEFRRRRDFLVGALNAIPGIEVHEPDGAFYLFPRVSAFGDSKTVADRLLDEAGVATLDGAGFGEAGAGHIRISYANSMENLAKAVDRMRRFFA